MTEPASQSETPDDASTSGTNGDINDGVGTYDVVILVEEELTAADAAQVRSLHEAIADRVIYHVLKPVEDAAGRIEATMGTLGAGEMLVASPAALSEIDLAAIRKECEEESQTELGNSLKALTAAGAEAKGHCITGAPVDALAGTVAEVDAREAIIVTRPHVVAEFFHVDWTSKARRKLGVPVLHLLEHENFDQQSGQGEGVTGL